jgi:hypothetical protein
MVALAIADVVAFDLAIPGQVFGHRDERERYSFAMNSTFTGLFSEVEDTTTAR